MGSRRIRALWLPGGHTALTDYEFLWGWSEHFAAILRDQYHIFNSDAAAPSNVHTRLDSYYHPAFKFLLVPFSQPRRFVNLKSNSVAQRMGKVLLQFAFSQHVAGSLVHGMSFDPGANGVNSCKLRFQYRRIDLLGLVLGR